MESKWLDVCEFALEVDDCSQSEVDCPCFITEWHISIYTNTYQRHR